MCGTLCGGPVPPLAAILGWWGRWIAGGAGVAGVPRGSSRHKKTRRVGRVDVDVIGLEFDGFLSHKLRHEMVRLPAQLRVSLHEPHERLVNVVSIKIAGE